MKCIARAVVRVGQALLLVILVACGGGGSIEAPETPQEVEPRRFYSYAGDFQSDAEPGWFTYQDGKSVPKALSRRIDADGNGYLVSKGPWWYDPNHTAPGLGYLHLLAFAYHASYELVDVPITPGQPLETSTGTIVYATRSPGAVGTNAAQSRTSGGRGVLSGLPMTHAIDLRGGVISLSARARELELPADADIYFWFQAFDPSLGGGEGRFVNYINVAHPIGRRLSSDRWTSISIPLTANEADWVCLGSNPDRLETYGCSSAAAAALSRFDVDLGFVILVGQQIRPIPISGEVHLDEIRLVVDAVNARDLPECADLIVGTTVPARKCP
jgi:hypothetical protein